MRVVSHGWMDGVYSIARCPSIPVHTDSHKVHARTAGAASDNGDPAPTQLFNFDHVMGYLGIVLGSGFC